MRRSICNIKTQHLTQWSCAEWQIQTNKTPQTQPQTTRKSPGQICVSSIRQQTRQKKTGQEPNNNTHKHKRICHRFSTDKSIHKERLQNKPNKLYSQLIHPLPGCQHADYLSNRASHNHSVILFLVLRMRNRCVVKGAQLRQMQHGSKLLEYVTTSWNLFDCSGIGSAKIER